MRRSTLLVVGLCVAVTVAAVGVRAQTPPSCAFENFDFTSLMGTQLTGSDGTYDYFLNPCAPLTAQPNCQANPAYPTSSVCLATPSLSEYLSLADISQPMKWSYIDETNPQLGVQYTEQSAEAGCTAPSGVYGPYTTSVQFVCAGEPGSMVVSSALDICLLNVTIPTPLACSPGPAQPCSWKSTAGPVYDFSSLAQSDIQAIGQTADTAYYFHVCGALESQPNCTSISNTASACEIETYVGGVSEYDLGDWNAASEAVWSFIDGQPSVGVQYTIQSLGNACWASGQGVPFTSVVQFTCSQTQQGATVTNPPNSCTFVWTLPTPLGCAPNKHQKDKKILVE